VEFSLLALSLTTWNSLLPVSSSSQFHPPSSHHSNMSMMPELSNSYLTLPPVDQLYTAAPQQQYSSSAPLGAGGVPRVAQTSGSGYRYYENMQSMSNWMPQNPSHLEPMDSYVRSLSIITLSFANLLVLYPVLSYTRQVCRGDIVRRYPAQSIPLILIVMHHCSPRAILGRPYHSAVLPNFIALLYQCIHTLSVFCTSQHYCIQFLSYRIVVYYYRPAPALALFSSFEVFDAKSVWWN
jgi:hypothetical protein